MDIQSGIKELRAYLVKRIEITESGYIVHAVDTANALERFEAEGILVGQADPIEIRVDEIPEDVYDGYMEIFQQNSAETEDD